MEITSERIKKLRDKTGAGMMDCKRALEASGGDLDAAIEHLRKKGAAVAQKRADRSAKEGMIVTRVTPDRKKGVMVEVNSETDFVGRSDDFVHFAGVVAEAAERSRAATVEALLAAPAEGGKTVAMLMNDLLAKVGEKIDVRRLVTFETTNGTVSAYTHLGNKIGVLVEVAGGEAAAAASAGRDLAMQIAAMSPTVVSREQVQKDTIDRELDIYKVQAAGEGKPAHIVEKIALGRLEKFFQEVALLEQTFIKDPGKTIRDYLKGASEGAAPITITRFQRFHLGEETN